MSSPESAALAARHARARHALDAVDLDALVVTTPVNIRYLTNHTGSAGLVVLTAEAVHLFVDFRYQQAIELLQASPAACPALRVWPVPASYDEALMDGLLDLGLRTAGFEAGHVTVARHDWWTRALAARATAVTLRPTDRLVESVRLVKDAHETARLREAAARLSPVAEAAFAAARPGASERAVALVIDDAMRTAGYERPAFDTIVASGPHTALPHHRAGARTLAAGDLLVLDFGGVLDGYCSDLTRTVSIGPPSSEARRVYQAVRDAQQAAIDAVRPGVTVSAVDAAARIVLEQHGLADAFGHGTGHGLGLEVHEEPRITRPRTDLLDVRLEPGMVFTIEPGAYLSGWGGVRIEDDVLVTAAGHEVLTDVSRDFLAVQG